MKKIILAAMVMMTMAGAANADNDWDYFWGTTVSQGLDPKLNGWDEFFGTTLNPENSGWNEFWNQCNEDKDSLDCVGTALVGLGLVVAAPIVGLAALSVGASAIAFTGTAIAFVPQAVLLVAAVM